MATVKLTAMERIVALNTLPKENNFINMRAIKKAISVLELTEEEAKEYVAPADPASPRGVIGFTKAGAEVEKEIDIGDVAFTLLKLELRLLDEKKTLKSEHLSLYSKIIGD
jgi:hypothetical protein